MDTPLLRAHNMIRSVINSGGTVSKYWMEDAMELLAKDGVLKQRAVDEGDSAPLQAESTPEHLPIEEAGTTPALRN